MTASDQCWALWGVQRQNSRDEFGWATRVHPDDRPRLIQELARALRERSVLEEDYRVVFPTGEERRLLSLGRTYPGPTRPTVIGITQDVSKRNEAEQARSALAAIVNSSEDAIIGKTLEGTITSWNAAAERMFGYRAEDVLGRNITLLIPSDRQHEEQQIIAAVKSGRGTSDYRSKRLRKDGTLIDVALTVSPVYDRHHRLIGASKIARDITVLKRAQEAEQEANRQKDTFLAVLAHELRNPLAPIRSAVRILEVKGSDEPEVRSARDVIDRQVDHLVRLVDDLLDISRMTLGKIRLRVTSIDLRELVQEALGTCRALLNERRHQVTLTTSADEVRVQGDWVRLVQVVANVLTNAARYTPHGGQVHVEVRSEGQRALIVVADTGIGLAPEDLPRVFDLFVQVNADESNRLHDGLGVGLALARNLIEMHGGTLTVASEGVDKGCRFIVTLPLAAAPAQPKSARTRTLDRRPPRRFRFLVVDDNVDAADSQAVLLGLLGHDVWTAYDGPTALVGAREHQPNVVLLDLGMPGMDGFEALRQLRALPELSQAVFVALTGWGQPEMREKSARSGFDIHVTKPVDLTALMRFLETAPQLAERLNA
jgi:PAS domain S-box-containing protein